MPRIRKFVGNFREMASKAIRVSFLLPEVQNELTKDALKTVPALQNLGQIFADLNRQRFLPTKNKTVDDFITDWSKPADSTYVQGQMTGNYFSSLLFTQFILNSNKFINEQKGRNEDNRMDHYHLDNRTSLEFGYYDDKGVLCGVSICASKLDPSLWTATITRNPTGKAEDREVTLFTSDEIHDHADTFIRSTNTSTNFFKALGSQEAQQQLAGIFLKNGTVNVGRIEEVSAHLALNHNVPAVNGTYVAKLDEINRLKHLFTAAEEAITEEYEAQKVLIETEQSPDMAIKLQKLTKIFEIRKFLLEQATNEQDIAAAQIATQRSGLELLEDTLRSDTGNTKALGRVLLAIKSGELTVNGQLPDETYPIGEYLTHGGRIKFDLTTLSAEEQNQFYAFITNNQAKPRPFATHRAGGTDANGSPAEAKSGLLGAISDAFRALVGASKHAGINLPIGGSHLATSEGTPKSLGRKPDESGEWGHMYVHQDSGMVMLGIEASAPGKHNVRTGEAHSKVGSAGEMSPFLQKKVDSQGLREEQIKEGKTPLSTKEKYNWASVKITPERLRQMIDADAGTDYVALVKTIPGNAKAAEPNRMEKMEAWAKATKDGNKTSLAAKIFGFTLFVLGLVLAFAPIPGVAQAVGGWLASVGLGVAAGTVTLGAGITAAAVGLGVFAAGTQQNPEKPQALYAKKLEKLPKVEDDHPQIVVEKLHDDADKHVVVSSDMEGFDQVNNDIGEIGALVGSKELHHAKQLVDSVPSKVSIVGNSKGIEPTTVVVDESRIDDPTVKV